MKIKSISKVECKIIHSLKICSATCQIMRYLCGINVQCDSILKSKIGVAIYDLFKKELIFKRKYFCGQIKTLTKIFDARIFKFNVNAIIKCITFANVAINNR